MSLSGVWPPSCTITPFGLLAVHDLEHVLERQRLEVQLVRDVEVGRDRLGIRVDHDRLVPLLAERHHRAHAAVVELDALPDPVRTAAEDDDATCARSSAPRSRRRSCCRGTASSTETRRRTCRPSCTPAGRRASTGARAPSSSVLAAQRAELAIARSPCASCGACRRASTLGRAPHTSARPRAAPASAARNHGSMAVSSYSSSIGESRARMRALDLEDALGRRLPQRAAQRLDRSRQAGDRPSGAAPIDPAGAARSPARAAPSGTLP